MIPNILTKLSVYPEKTMRTKLNIMQAWNRCGQQKLRISAPK